MASSRAGRKPKPLSPKILDGNPNKRPLNKAEPAPKVEIPACPRWLKGDARSEWRRIVPELKALGLLSKIDRAALTAYCQAWADYLDAIKQIEKNGSVLEIRELAKDGEKEGRIKYMQQSPYVSIKNKAAEHMHKFLTEFGMTPASRSRISVAKTDTPKGGMGDFFK